jgi:hypothetical protein
MDRSAVRRNDAENYILISLVAFAVSVIATRLFLELTGYPQIGNSVLHIAHALWGGLSLIIAFMLPLAFANRWAFQLSALLGGIGIGLFIDEVGKFITQANDYFYPPAMPLIYGSILLIVLVYLYFRRSHQDDPRKAMYHAFEGLQDILDGDLDTLEASQIEIQLAIAKESNRDEIVSLANAINGYLQAEMEDLPAAEPGLWQRFVNWVERTGMRAGRRFHRTVISLILVLWLIFAIAFITVLVLEVPTVTSQIIQWSTLLIGIQVVVGVSMIIALVAWLTGKEEVGLKFGIIGFLLSLVAFQTIYFYLSQFSAIIATLLQLIFLFILLAYRSWYLEDSRVDIQS